MARGAACRCRGGDGGKPVRNERRIVGFGQVRWGVSVAYGTGVINYAETYPCSLARIGGCRVYVHAPTATGQLSAGHGLTVTPVSRSRRSLGGGPEEAPSSPSVRLGGAGAGRVGTRRARMAAWHII